MQEYVALAGFAAVYVLIIGRRRFGVPIWVATLIGAALMVCLHVIDIGQAYDAVNLEVIAFLFGMFSIISALERSGVLRLIAMKVLSWAKTPSQLLMAFVVGMGVLSAFLVNDTIALLGIPLTILVAKHTGIKPTVLLLALAFGITVGSVMTPIGNPQNLLIAIDSGFDLPFRTFLFYLAVPTVANLFVTYLILKLYFRKDLPQKLQYAPVAPEVAIGESIPNPRQARIAVYITIATLGGFLLSEILHVYGIAEFSISIVAMLGAAALYALSSDRTQLLRHVDYSVLVFFAAMFVVTSSMWQSGAISIITGWLPDPNPADEVQSLNVITAASLALSQVLSNVPFVALYDFVMIDAGFGEEHVAQWLMLAAASTVAGNLTILGAASNIIVIEAAEARGVRTFSFVEFSKIGAVITVANVAIFYGFIYLVL